MPPRTAVGVISIAVLAAVAAAATGNAIWPALVGIVAVVGFVIFEAVNEAG